MKKIVTFLMCLCCAMSFFACGQDNSGTTGKGDSSQIEQDSSDISDDSSSDSSEDTSSDSEDSSANKNDDVWTPPAKH